MSVSLSQVSLSLEQAVSVCSRNSDTESSQTIRSNGTGTFITSRHRDCALDTDTVPS